MDLMHKNDLHVACPPRLTTPRLFYMQTRVRAKLFLLGNAYEAVYNNKDPSAFKLHQDS